MLCKHLLVCGKFKFCFLEISVCFSNISDLGLIKFTDAEPQTWRAHCSMGRFEDRFRAACTFWLGWAEVEMGAEGDKEGNQSPRGKLQGNTAHRLGNWSASSLHCWKDRNGKKCLQCSGIMHRRKFWAACLWERWRDHSSPFVLFFFIVFPANFFFLS